MIGPTADRASAMFQWLRQVQEDPAISSAGFELAFVIGQYMSRGGVAWPSQETLAGALRMSKRNIRNLTDQLVSLGHLQVTATPGRGHTSRYRLLEKGNCGSSFGDEKGNGASSFNEAKRGNFVPDKGNHSSARTT
jgi:hypothetical protein